jgi:sulfide:quinone oxidoreductase
MEGFRVVICGGGIAGAEGLLRLRRLLGDEASLTLVAPNDELRYRPLAVKEPFAMAGVRRYPVQRLVSDTGAEWVRAGLVWLDPDRQVAHVDEGAAEVPYDALLIAVGGRSHQDLPHVATFSDSHDAYTGIVQDIEGGYTKTIALVMPNGPTWPLPLYELALMTAARARGMGADDLQIHFFTPEPEPLAAFGGTVSQEVTARLERAGIALHAGAMVQVPEGGHVVVQAQGLDLHVDRIVALPRVAGPAIRGIAGGGAEGFIPVDRHCSVPGTGGHVFAAGDATAFPVKHGGIGSQQADVAAAGIARLAGAGVEAPEYKPTIRAVLLTGERPLYLTARLVGDRGFGGEISEESPWETDDKVIAEELGPYLKGLDDEAEREHQRRESIRP